MKYAGSLLALLVPGALLAHPGHGVFDGLSLAHHLASPVHVAVLFAGLVLTAAAWRWVPAVIRNRRNK